MQSSEFSEKGRMQTHSLTPAASVFLALPVRGISFLHLMKIFKLG